MSEQNASETASAVVKTSRLYHFAEWYAGYHGYLSIVVCVVGVVSSIFVIAVLTRRHMINPTNYMLTALAVFDLLTMLSYIPFALQFYVLHGTKPNPRRNTLAWAYFCLVYANFSVTAHTVSIWLGVVLSAFRYAFVRRSRDGAVLTNDLRSVRLATGIVVGASVVVLLPNYASLTIAEVVDEGSNRTLYEVDHVGSSSSYADRLNTVNFWMHAVVVKLLPCALMSVFGCLLLLTVHQIHRRGADLRTRATTLTAAAGKNDAKTRRREKAHSRTTAMLVAVIVLFLATELPQGLLSLCSGLQPVFFESYYVPLGDIMDIVALINNGINFTLYCTMSQQFRKTLLALVRGRPTDPVTQHTH